MEAKLLQYFKQTRFAKEYADCIELLPQFSIGNYLRQLDPTYQHLDYKVDFLLKVFVDNVTTFIFSHLMSSVCW
jgi:hypothetical protein